MTLTPGRLVLSEITKAYDGPQGSTAILRGASLTVEPGSTLAVVGPSGSGKSTLLHIIGSLDKPTSGSVVLNGVEVTALEGNRLADFRANDVGFVFQEHYLLPQLTAIENVLLPTIPAGRTAGANERARDLLEEMGVLHRSEAFPAQMSGGERQRTAVARALINGAKLLLCDEPTGNLDREAGSNMISLLTCLAEEQDVSIIVVTHNLEHATRLGTGFELLDGHLVALNACAEADGIQ